MAIIEVAGPRPWLCRVAPGWRAGLMLRPRGRARARARARDCSVPAGTSRRVTVPLTSAGRRAVRSGKPLKAVIKLTAARSGATTVNVQRTVSLRAVKSS
jgi:hypothetical protein